MIDSLSWGKIGTSVFTGTVLALLIGNPSPLLVAMFVLFFIDLLTGIIKGLYTNKFTSHALRKGVTKFLGYCLSIVVAHQFAIIPFLFWVEPSLLAWLALAEFTSIVENLRQCGLNVPDIQSLVNFYKDRIKSNETK